MNQFYSRFLRPLLITAVSVFMLAGQVMPCTAEEADIPEATASSPELLVTEEMPETASSPDEIIYETAATAGVEATSLPDEGKVLNIECFNEEFKTRVVDHYPTYVEENASTGKIGDVTVRWFMTSTDSESYQNRLNELLPENENKAPDERIDMFLAEESFLGRYVDARKSVTVPIANLGITEEELSGQFQYTLDAATDYSGTLRGLTWQCTPGVMIYNRQAAIDTWGTDDPEEVQKHVDSWENFMKSADELLEKGYSITSSVMDTFQVCAGSVSDYWVLRDGTLNLPENISIWMKNSKILVDAGEATTSTMWSADWSTGLMPEGKVFCCFGPEWMIRYCLSQDVTGSLANRGGWAVCPGPQAFFWRGTWLFAARGTDNPALVADIMRTLCTDELIMGNIRTTDGDFVNNKKVMAADADSERYALDILGGQNPTKYFIENASRLSGTHVTRYDEACRAVIRSVSKRCFEGTYSYDDAVGRYYTRVRGEYPELT